MAKIKGKQQICKSEIKYFKAIQTIGGYDLIDRYRELENIVNSRISDEYRHFFAQPLKETFSTSDNLLITWHVKSWRETPQKLLELQGKEKDRYEKIKTETLEHYNTVIHTLKNGNADEKNAAEYLEKALKYVDDCFIYCFDNKTFLGVWGMLLRDEVRTDPRILESDSYPVVVTFNPGIDGLLKGDAILNKQKYDTVKTTEIPEVAANEGYEFIGWDKDPNNFKVIGNTEFTAQYRKIVEEPAPEMKISENIPPVSPPVVPPEIDVIDDGGNDFIVTPVAEPRLPWWRRWFAGGCMKKLLWFLFIILLLLILICLLKKCNCNCGPQIIDQTGYLPEMDDMDNIPDDVPPFDDDDLDNLPHAVSLEHWFPPIGDQEALGTCVAWAVGYNLKTALNAMENRWTPEHLDSATNQISPKDLWMSIPAHLKGRRCEGTGFEAAFNVLITLGAASMDISPYANLGNCTGASLGNENDKLAEFRKVPNISVSQLKGYLNAGQAIAFGARLGDRFMEWRSNGVLSSDTHNYTGIHANHAMVLVGYDDLRNAFRVRNSWGTGWGDYGSIWIDYNFFCQNFCFAAFVAKNPQNNQKEKDNMNIIN